MRRALPVVLALLFFGPSVFGQDGGPPPPPDREIPYDATLDQYWFAGLVSALVLAGFVFLGRKKSYNS